MDMSDAKFTKPPAMKGELVTEVLEYDGGRTVTVYVPPVHPPEAVVFAGDGHMVAQWGVALEDAAADNTVQFPRTMIVGAHRATDETRRLHEYVDAPALFDDPAAAERFAAHERFFVDEVRAWVAARWFSGGGGTLPAAPKMAVLGVSAGGEFALAMGLRHRDLYGAVFCLSPGAGYRPSPAGLPENGADAAALPRVYLAAGNQEPFFKENAARWAAALRSAGRDVVLAEREGGHGGAFWQQELPRMVAWAFGSGGAMAQAEAS